jgi:hypothetical protein
MQFTVMMEERVRSRTNFSHITNLETYSDEETKPTSAPCVSLVFKSPLQRFLFTFGIPRSCTKLLDRHC